MEPGSESILVSQKCICLSNSYRVNSCVWRHRFSCNPEGVLPENVKLQCSSAAAEGSIRGNVNDDFVVYVLPCIYLYQYLEVILFRRCHGCDATVKALLLCYTGCGTYCSPVRRVHNRLFYSMKSKTKWRGRRGQCRCKFITLVTKSPDQHWWDSDLTLSRQINVSLTMTPKSLFSDNQVGCHANYEIW